MIAVDTIVLDASAALEIVMDMTFGEVLFEGVRNAGEVIAPDLYHAEVASALWKYIKAGALSFEDGREKLTNALALVDRFVSMRELTMEAFHEADKQGHSIYDLYYLVLTRRENALLMSRDRKLIDLVDKERLRLVECATVPF